MKHPNATFLLAFICLPLCVFVSVSDELLLNVKNVVLEPSETDPIDSFFDVFFEIAQPDAGRNDMAGYKLALDLSPADSGISLAAAEQPPVDGPHLPVFPTAPPINLSSTDDRI